MRAWRLVAPRHAARALTGEGAAAFGGRWNPVGRRMVYAADSLALATLELSVHLTGARLRYTAIELAVPDHLVDTLEVADLRRTWATNSDVTTRVGEAWAASGRSLALAVPSVLVDPRSGERNLLIDPANAGIAAVTEVKRFEVMIDERL